MERNKKKENYSLNTKKGSYKNIKLTDLYKDLYSSQTADVINSLKRSTLKKHNRQTLQATDKIEKINTLHTIDLDKEYIKNTISSRYNEFPFKTEELSENKDYFETKILSGIARGSRRSGTDQEVDGNNTCEIKVNYDIKNNKRIIIDSLESRRLSKNLLFKTSFPISGDKNDNLRNRQSVAYENVNKFFCPYCDHCNNMKDQNLEKHMQNLLQANVIINKGFDYMVKNLKFYDKTVIELFSFTENNIEDIIKDDKPYKYDKITKDDKEDIFETLIHNYPKKTTNRITYKIVSHFLNALLEDKINMESVMSPELMENINDTVFYKGQSFRDKQENKVFIDKELEGLFDEKTKNVIENLFEKKYLKFDMLKTDEYLKTRTLKEITKKDTETKKYEKSLNFYNSTKDSNERKFIVLFLIFIQILSEISLECKERAILLYKFFKIYFVEQEKKWISAVNKMKDKIRYYKELCKTIMQMKNNQIDKIEEINDVLFRNKLTKGKSEFYEENLNNHKSLIQSLLKMNTEKREEIYLIRSQKEILEKEINLWVYDYDKIKINTEIRNRLKEINMSKLLSNVKTELSHKNMQHEEKSLLINADRFLLLSGQRFYFYEQKKYLQAEIDRLNELYKKYYYKKKNQKEQILKLKEEFTKSIGKYEMEINYYKNKLTVDKFDVEVQTEINKASMNKIMKNHESVVYFKRLNNNKLTNYIERIKYGCSKNKPITKRSLLNLIPEIYNEKIDQDSKSDPSNDKRSPFDEFFHKFMEEKFKLKKLVKKHCEETILSIIEYSNEDHRIDLVRRFLGIGEDKLNKFVFEIFLTLIKSLPISFYKLFADDHAQHLMNTELCFEIYHAKLREFKSLASETKYNLLRATTFCINEKEYKYVGEDKIYEYMLVNRFYNKAYVFLNELLADFKNIGKTYEILDKFYESFAFSNKEFNIKYEEFCRIFQKLFKILNGKVDLETFFAFFNDKKYTFKIRNDDFIEISLNTIISEHDYLISKLTSLFESVDVQKKGILYFKEFEELMSKIFTNIDTRWKNNEYFLNALRGQEKEFLTKEEFIIFAVNNKEFIYELSH